MFPSGPGRFTMTALQTLFDILDLDQDGELSRSELFTAARTLRWHWREAPLFALLDWLTVSTPLTRDRFMEAFQKVAKDPMGPYGNVLRTVKGTRGFHPDGGPESDIFRTSERDEPYELSAAGATEYLSANAGVDVSESYDRLLSSFDIVPLSRSTAALLIIDPQRSFTEGVWMRSIGHRAAQDVAPIRLAFDRCAAVLRRLYGRLEIMFSRCPFPPESYGWYTPLEEILDRSQPYFIKPGNSILFPRTNGFREWIDRCIDEGKRSLVIGGCTLNSCVRVSSTETQALFPLNRLQVIVDVSLCGARGRNYRPSPEFGGDSAAASAVAQMTDAGVAVVRGVDWH